MESSYALLKTTPLFSSYMSQVCRSMALKCTTPTPPEWSLPLPIYQLKFSLLILLLLSHFLGQKKKIPQIIITWGLQLLGLCFEWVNFITVYYYYYKFGEIHISTDSYSHKNILLAKGKLSQIPAKSYSN